jgi:hypothetical protein
MHLGRILGYKEGLVLLNSAFKSDHDKHILLIFLLLDSLSTQHVDPPRNIQHSLHLRRLPSSTSIQYQPYPRGHSGRCQIHPTNTPRPVRGSDQPGKTGCIGWKCWRLVGPPCRDTVGWTTRFGHSACYLYDWDLSDHGRRYGFLYEEAETGFVLACGNVSTSVLLQELSRTNGTFFSRGRIASLTLRLNLIWTLQVRRWSPPGQPPPVPSCITMHCKKLSGTTYGSPTPPPNPLPPRPIRKHSTSLPGSRRQRTRTSLYLQSSSRAGRRMTKLTLVVRPSWPSS